MSRLLMVGLGHFWRKVSSSCAGSSLAGAGPGGGSSANVNVVSPVSLGIAVFLRLLGRAAVDKNFVFGGVAQIYRDGEPFGIGDVFLVVEAGGGAELLRGFDPVPRVCPLVAEDGPHDLG